MEKFTLNNGLTVIYEKKPSKSVAIEVTVKAGSNNESSQNNGISHFLEHMIFEGTKKRPTSLIISNEIEKLGGEMNAFTSNERTSFFIKILDKHFVKAIDILSDIIINSTFKVKSIEKERKVISKEVDLVYDEPRFYQWTLFNQALFIDHPAKRPIYGRKEVIEKLSRKDLLDYYGRFYRPQNMILSIVGNIKNIRSHVKKYFGSFNKPKIDYTKVYPEKPSKSPALKVVKRKLQSSYFILGYKVPVRLEKESYAFDIIYSILGRGQSGRLFEEIRNKYGLAYEVGVNYEPGINFGYFAVYLNTDKRNISKVKKIILKEFSKLRNLKSKDIEEAKTHIEGSFELENEDNFHKADKNSYWEMVKDASLSKDYIKNIKKVTEKDIIKVVSKFLNKNYAIAIIQQT